MAKMLLRIDLHRLQTRLARSAGRDMGECEVRLWLEQHGFAATVMGWTAEEACLTLLEPPEIIDRVPFADNCDLRGFWIGTPSHPVAAR